MINLITNALPETVFVDGLGQTPINTDFRVGIQVSLIHDSSLTASDKALAIFMQYFGDPRAVEEPECFEAMVRAAEAFARLDDLAVIVGSSKRTSKRRTFDWDCDQKRLIADFEREYRLDLVDPATKIHWWRFLVLFEHLSPKSHTMAAIGYRSMTVSSDLPKKEKERLHKLKRDYQLPPLNALEAEAADRELWGDSK